MTEELREDQPYFDGEEEFLVDPSDQTDTVAIARAAHRRRVMFVVAAAAGVALALSLTGWQLLRNASRDDAPAPAPQASATASAGTARKPLLEQFGKAPAAIPGPVTATAKGSTVTTTKGRSLTITGQKLVPASKPCVVTKATDFCLAARAVTPERVAYDVYFLKDAVNSRLFENPAGYAKASIPGSPSAGTMRLDLGSVKAPVLAAANQDGSGWMIVFMTPPDAAQVKAITDKVTVR